MGKLSQKEERKEDKKYSHKQAFNTAPFHFSRTRCHKTASLLKYKQDRHRWIQRLFEAKRQFGIVVLNYAVTSNHIHLTVKEDGKRKIIPQAIGLVAGRTALEFKK